LELYSPPAAHHMRAEKIGQLIRVIAEEWGVGLIGGGSARFRRQDRDCGLEPDRCFYVANSGRICGKSQINLAVDPPPDLCVEIESSLRLVDRMGVYARLGVPEVWRDDGMKVHILALRDNSYVRQETSLAFPVIAEGHLAELLRLGDGIDDTTWVGGVREWIREKRGQ
jgi:Uma2 family endonuclease